MFNAATVVVLVTATAIRARRDGHSWTEIAAFPSKWFNWTFLGREFGEPFSAFVGLQVREGVPPQWFWRGLCLIIDMVLWPRERHHCAETLHRLEKKNREYYGRIGK